MTLTVVLREHVSSTCATLGRLAQGSGGAAVTQTATASPPGYREHWVWDLSQENLSLEFQNLWQTIR